MKRILNTLILLFLMATSSFAHSPEIITKCVKLTLSCSVINNGGIFGGIHRTPPASPTVYFDSEDYYLYFESPIDCTLQLTTTDTQEIVFSTDIQDGEQEILLPGRLSGEYELQIIVGQFVFYTTITL